VHLAVLLGAPGAGKTTLLRHLHGRPMLVADMDEILEDGALLGAPIASPEGAGSWPAYNRLWARIIAMIVRANVPVVLSAPVTPSEWRDAATDAGLDVPTTFLLLDCADDVRSRRLAERAWSASRIGEAVADAAALRELGLPVLDSTSATAPALADELSRMVLPCTGTAPG
jgi:predicted kinase